MVEDSKNNGTKSNVSYPMLRRTMPNDLSMQFLRPGATYDESLRKSRLTDENQLNDMLRLLARLKRWNIESGIETLMLKINALPAIGGFPSVYALMSKVEIVDSEALGVPLGKRSTSEINKIKDHRQMHRKDGRNEEESKQDYD